MADRAMKPDQKVYALVMGKVVRTLRTRASLTQIELADRCGVAQATISRIERGTLIPDAMLTGRLADALGVPLSDLHAYVEEGVERTRHAAEGAMGPESAPQGQPWWATPLAVAGIAGLAGLAMFAVAAALQEDEEDA